MTRSYCLYAKYRESDKKYINNLPGGMTARLDRIMTVFKLLDMYYFLIEDDDFDDELKEGIYFSC